MLLVGAENLDLDHIDRLLRTNEIASVLARSDEVLLKDALGLDRREISILHTIWDMSKNSRMNRRHKIVWIRSYYQYTKF